MRKIFLFAAVVAGVLSSCSKNEVTTSFNDDQAIGFGVYTGEATKGGNATSESLKAGFGVFGFYTEDQDFAYFGYKAANFMYNTEVSFAGGAWTYSPMKYWSEGNSDKYTFYAYYPYSENDQVSVVGSNVNHPKVRVTVPTTVADMVDFVADVRVDVTSSADGNVSNPTADDAETVAFTMQHEMTKVAFMLKSDVTGDSHEEDNTTIVVKNIKFQGADFATTGVYTFATKEDVIGTWANTGSATLVPALTPNNIEIGTGDKAYAEKQGVAVENNAKIATNLFGDKQYLFLLPPNGETGLATDGEIEIELTYDIATKDTALQHGYTASIDNVKTVNIPAESLKQGVAYNYTLIFSMNEVTLSATVDTEGWDSEGSNIVGGTEE